MIKKLLLISFIEGATVMTAELCGAKLLAPLFGSSLYVWAAVMGITLTALAMGYFFGGLLSEESKQNSKTLTQILIVASLFVVAMPVISRYILPWISYLPFLIAVVVSTCILLFFPLFFLGATSPLFIALQTKNIQLTGKTSGIVYAISTAGGILATFSCGFFLIPTIGLTYCLMLFGTILFLTTIIIFKFYKIIFVILFVLIAYLNLQFSILKDNKLYHSNSVLGELEVLDVFNAKKETIRILKINTIIQTEMNVETKQSVSDYIKLIDTLVPYTFHQKQALVLGLGGGITANLFHKKNYITEGVEFDEEIIKTAKTYFDLNKNIKTIYSDARYFLNHCNKKYEFILVDIFKAEEQPSHIITLESLKQLKNNLTDSAILIINWHGYLKGKNGIGTSILNNTLLKSGYFVKVCTITNNEDYRNLLFICSTHKLKPLPYQIKPLFEKTDLINTDNLPLFEKYNASANKAWRSNYLNYYQAYK